MFFFYVLKEEMIRMGWTYVGTGLKGITLVLVGLDLRVRETIHTDLVLLGP